MDVDERGLRHGLDGVFPSNYTETYSSNVDAVGTMTTPYGVFPVLRVATNLADLQVGVAFNSNKTFAWQAECFGTVAKITSGSNETGEEFGSAAEVRIGSHRERPRGSRSPG